MLFLVLFSLASCSVLPDFSSTKVLKVGELYMHESVAANNSKYFISECDSCSVRVSHTVWPASFTVETYSLEEFISRRPMNVEQAFTKGRKSIIKVSAEYVGVSAEDYSKEPVWFNIKVEPTLLGIPKDSIYAISFILLTITVLYKTAVPIIEKLVLLE